MKISQMFDEVINQYKLFHYEVYGINLPPSWLKQLCEECGSDRRFFDKYKGIPLTYSDQLRFIARAVAYDGSKDVSRETASESVVKSEDSSPQGKGEAEVEAKGSQPEPLPEVAVKKRRGMPKGGWPKKSVDR